MNLAMTNTGTYRSRIIRRARRLDIRGADHCINEWGDPSSPLLVVLHGWADTGSTFQFLVDALSADWFVVAPDWRGFGRTENNGEAYWFPDYIADLHRLLDDYSPDDPARLVGHSMGGNVASLYAGVMPERVAALVNVEGFGLRDSNPDDAPQRFRDWIEAEQIPPVFSNYGSFEQLAHRIKKRSPRIGDAEADFVAREWAYEGDDGLIHLRADPCHKLPNATLYRRQEAEACWRLVTAEVLLVSGDRSPFAEKSSSSSPLPFANSQSCVIEDAGHMIHFESAPALARAIEGFLKIPL